MGVKLHSYGRATDNGGLDWGECLVFHCPGCRYDHPFHTGGDPNGHPQWKFNGDMERPTFRPSLLVNKSHPENRCHLYMTGGMIHFFSDCWHALKGQIVECPDWEENEGKIRTEALERNIAGGCV